MQLSSLPKLQSKQECICDAAMLGLTGMLRAWWKHEGHVNHDGAALQRCKCCRADLSSKNMSLSCGAARHCRDAEIVEEVLRAASDAIEQLSSFARTASVTKQTPVLPQRSPSREGPVSQADRPPSPRHDQPRIPSSVQATVEGTTAMSWHVGSLKACVKPGGQCLCHMGGASHIVQMVEIDL